MAAPYWDKGQQIAAQSWDKETTDCCAILRQGDKVTTDCCAILRQGDNGLLRNLETRGQSDNRLLRNLGTKGTRGQRNSSPPCIANTVVISIRIAFSPRALRLLSVLCANGIWFFIKCV